MAPPRHAATHGATKARSYTLSAGLYQAMGNKAAYTRQLGFSALQNEQMVLNYIRQHGQIKRAEVMELCRLSEGQAKDLLKRLKEQDFLLQHGERRGAHYTLGDAVPITPSAQSPIDGLWMSYG